MTWHWSSDEAFLNQWVGLNLHFDPKIPQKILFYKSCYIPGPHTVILEMVIIIQYNNFCITLSI